MFYASSVLFLSSLLLLLNISIWAIDHSLFVDALDRSFVFFVYSTHAASLTAPRISHFTTEIRTLPYPQSLIRVLPLSTVITCLNNFLALFGQPPSSLNEAVPASRLSQRLCVVFAAISFVAMPNCYLCATFPISEHCLVDVVSFASQIYRFLSCSWFISKCAAISGVLLRWAFNMFSLTNYFPFILNAVGKMSQSSFSLSTFSARNFACVFVRGFYPCCSFVWLFPGLRDVYVARWLTLSLLSLLS